jgi:hypothetical protein
MDKSKTTGALFMDLKKAFDTINHSCLLQKLPFYGITGNEIKWISSYLFNRSQTVFIGAWCASRLDSGALAIRADNNDLPCQLKYCHDE